MSRIQSRRAAALLIGLLLPAPAWSRLFVDVEDLDLDVLATGLDNPVAVTNAGDSRLFITLQGGEVVIFDGGGILPRRFLDLRSRVSSGGERGLFSIAFHPAYASNGFVYAFFTDRSGDDVIARYSVSPDPDVADPASEAVLLEIREPFSNHNGGQLQFGPDGFLYAGTGDGGSANDPRCSAQDGSRLLGKMLRLDVDQNVDAPPYHGIPASNPFVGDAGVRDEVWALGLRNPWRFSFDRETGDLYIADVGQDLREEVDLQAAASGGGENYGWKMMEGFRCTNNTAGCGFAIPVCNAPEYTPPIFEYGHENGRCSITGGYVYRGQAVDRVRGAYFYGDFCSGEIWAAEKRLGSWIRSRLAVDVPYLTSFGEDRDGELYLVSGDRLYRLVDGSAEGCRFVNGDSRFCAECGPCAEGQGSCRGDDQCEEGLTCAEDFGARFGLSRRADVCLRPGSLAPPPYELTELAPTEGADRIRAAALNDAGEVVGTLESFAPGGGLDSVAFRAGRGSEIEVLDPQPSSNAAGVAIDDRGDVFGLLLNRAGGQKGFFVHSQAGGFDFLDRGADNRIRRTFRFEDMSPSGVLAGSVQRGGGVERPYVYTPEDGWTDLAGVDPRFRRFGARVVLVNERGDLVVHRPSGPGSPGVSETFLLRGDRLFELGDFGEPSNTPEALNPSGWIVGSSVSAGDAKSHAYLFNGPGGRLIDIHPRRFDSSNAVYVTAKGIVGGTIATEDEPDTLFTWDNRRQRRMSLQARAPNFRQLLAGDGLTLERIVDARMNERLEFVGRLVATNSEVLFLRFFYYSPATGLVDVQDLLEAAGSSGAVSEITDLNDWGALLLRVDQGAGERVVVLSPVEN